MICPNCLNKMGKNGVRGGMQRWLCRSCGNNTSTPLTISTGYDHVESGDVLRINYDRTIKIHALTDVHYGANEHHEEKFDEAIEIIKNDPDARWFGNGDLIELIPSFYKISQRGQRVKNERQVIEVIDKLMPISEKCLFIRPGNHELRAMNIMDFEVTEIIASQLGIPIFSLPGYTIITIEGKEWKLASGHGKSAAKNGDLELFKLKEIYSEADIFYLGHDHKLYAKPMPSLGVDEGGEFLSKHWFIRGGAFLKYADYARYSFYPLQKVGWVEMIFSKDEIKCNVHE